jgi:hypothetical protein
MHSLTYCAFIFLVISLCIAAPAKAPNGCGYEVKNFEEMFVDYIKSDGYCRYAI